MARSDMNDVFERTSFLYGGNARFIEDLHERYLKNPSSVDEEWRRFFEGLGDEGEPRGPSWQRRDWPEVANGELVSALDGDWEQAERQVARRIETRAREAGTVSSARIDERPVLFDAVPLGTTVYARELLPVGGVVAGPALVEEPGTTTVVPPGVRAAVDAHANLVLERG